MLSQLLVPTTSHTPLLEEFQTRLPAAAGGDRPAFPGRHQERSQPAKTVGADEACRDQFGQSVFHLRAQEAGPVHQFVEKRRTVLLDAVGKQLRPRTRMHGSITRGQ